MLAKTIGAYRPRLFPLQNITAKWSRSPTYHEHIFISKLEVTVGAYKTGRNSSSNGQACGHDQALMNWLTATGTIDQKESVTRGVRFCYYWIPPMSYKH